MGLVHHKPKTPNPQTPKHQAFDTTYGIRQRVQPGSAGPRVVCQVFDPPLPSVGPAGYRRLNNPAVPSRTFLHAYGIRYEVQDSFEVQDSLEARSPEKS